MVLGACTHTDEVVTTASVPDDYRLRHPIAIQEADQSTVIFVGHGRGGLSASQRTDVIGLAQTWLREGTGAISADVPVEHAECANGGGHDARNSARCSLRPACRRAGSSSANTSPTTRATWQRSA